MLNRRCLAPISQTWVNLGVALFIVLLGNFAFFKSVFSTFGTSFSTVASAFSIGVVLVCLLHFLLSLISYGRAAKLVLTFILMLSASIAYFSDAYGVIMDKSMLRNVFQTNTAEALDLLSLKLFFYLIFLGVAPSVLVLWLPVAPEVWRERTKRMARDVTLSLIGVVLALLISSNFYASFLREHKALRFHVNPIYFFYSAADYVTDSVSRQTTVIAQSGLDAHINPADHERDLVIFVLGEAARADHFSLNGYARETNPLLAKENVMSFRNVYSCGTSTAESVPCLFSVFGRDAFTHQKAEQTENLVDVLAHTGSINVLWRDNNSNSKGVAVRVPYEDYKTSRHNTICDGECRDVGMLVGLQEYIDRAPLKDIFIVLHQMGNHGPAYYKRYPKEFEKFQPTCKTSEFDQCQQQEIINAYDNAILYTDYFLSQVIALLKQNDQRFETAMFYMSDHGESLGENGIYLHGLPYALAPDAQKKVGAIMWFGERMRKEIKIEGLKSKAANTYSHDNVFHTILSLFEVETSLYDPAKDIIRGCKHMNDRSY